MVLDLAGGLFHQSDVRETPAGTSSSTSSTSILAPIGTILAWLKSYANTPQELPTGWMEADGSAISDADSVYNGQNAPDLNGGEFLRGFTTSGGTGGSDTMAHTHGVTSNVAVGNHTALTVNAHSNHTALALNTENAHTHTGTAAGTTGSGSSHSHSSGTYAAAQSGTTKNVGELSQTTVSNYTHTHDVTGTSGSVGSHNHSFSDGFTTSGGAAHGHTFSTNISAHSDHAFGQNISNHSVTNNAVTSGAASNTENRPPYYNVVWIFRYK